MEFNDRVASLLACAVYYDKVDEEMRDKNVPSGWERKDKSEHPDSGFYCLLFVKVRHKYCRCKKYRKDSWPSHNGQILRCIR